MTTTLIGFPDRLEGDGVVLRPMAIGDITETYIAWLNDPVLMRFSNQRFLRHTHESCLRYLQSFSGSSNLFLGVHLANDDQLVGTMTAYRSAHHATTDVGILIGAPSVHGSGVGGKAWNLLAEWLLMVAGTRKLTCGTLACNQAMVRLAERCGMHREAVRRQQELIDGRAEDMLYFARFADA